MKFFRTHTGSDGLTYIEERFPDEESDLMSAHAAVDIRFLDLAEGTLVERHNPPSLQYVIVLSSQIELGLREGVTQRLSPETCYCRVIRLDGDTRPV